MSTPSENLLQPLIHNLLEVQIEIFLIPLQQKRIAHFVTLAKFKGSHYTLLELTMIIYTTVSFSLWNWDRSINFLCWYLNNESRLAMNGLFSIWWEWSMNLQIPPEYRKKIVQKKLRFEPFSPKGITQRCLQRNCSKIFGKIQRKKSTSELL